MTKKNPFKDTNDNLVKMLASETTAWMVRTGNMERIRVECLFCNEYHFYMTDQVPIDEHFPCPNGKGNLIVKEVIGAVKT